MSHPSPASRTPMRRHSCPSSLFLVGVLCLLGVHSASAADWWTMPDADFISTYGKLATGTQADQSKFAWMVFGRVNQKVNNGGHTYSAWELWDSDYETFHLKKSPLFALDKKIRTAPRLQRSALLANPRLQKRFKLKFDLKELDVIPDKSGEEVTRNVLSATYIRDHKLDSRAGIAAYLAMGNKIDFPGGTVETKAKWVQQAIPNAYQITDPNTKAVYSLLGIHLMIKVAPQPASPFTDDAPSWFWTTFEFNGNDGLAAAQKFITYGNTLSAADRAALLTEAGLSSAPWTNYVCNGSQIQYNDSKNPQILLGNTQIEGFLGEPSGPPQQWTSWSTSCHSCHGQASGNPAPFDSTSPVGPLVGDDLPGQDYKPFDFNWALSRAK